MTAMGEPRSVRRMGRLTHAEEGLSYGSTSQLTVSDLDKAGRFTMQAICNPVNIDRVDRAAAEELDRFLKDGLTADEVAEAKKAYLQARKVSRAGDQAVATQLLEGLYAGRTMAFYAELEAGGFGGSVLGHHSFPMPLGSMDDPNSNIVAWATEVKRSGYEVKE